MENEAVKQEEELKKKRKRRKKTKEEIELAKLSKEEIADRKQLMDYVFFNVLGYKSGQKIGSTLALRIEGLRNGQYLGKNKALINKAYDYKMIYYTFVLCSAQIKHALATASFENETHRINYIMIIVENNINDVYESIQKKKIADEVIDKKEFNIDVEAPNRYKRKEQPKTADLFDDDIW